MSTDFYLVINKDLKRFGTRGGSPVCFFHWLVEYDDVKAIEPFEIWDDFANTYNKEEFESMVALTTQTGPDEYPGYPSAQIDFPNGTEGEYWKHKSPESKYRDRYKALVTGKST